MIGGAYLCFEGAEKLAHKFLHRPEEDALHHEQLVEALSDPEVDILAFERDKIQGAVRTDFILSAEIIVIALGTAAGGTFLQQCIVLAGIAILMTVGVYGLVACIVKLDDVGLHLTRRADAISRGIGRGLLLAAPRLMQFLSVAGTVAMFLVGGGILVHGMPGAHALLHALEEILAALPDLGGLTQVLVPLVVDGLVGLIAGALLVAIVTLSQKLRGRTAATR